MKDGSKDFCNAGAAHHLYSDGSSGDTWGGSLFRTDCRPWRGEVVLNSFVGLDQHACYTVPQISGEHVSEVHSGMKIKDFKARVHHSRCRVS